MENDYPIALLKVKAYVNKAKETITRKVRHNLRTYLSREGFLNFDINMDKKKGTLELFTKAKASSNELSFLEEKLKAFCLKGNRKRPYDVEFEMYDSNS